MLRKSPHCCRSSRQRASLAPQVPRCLSLLVLVGGCAQIVGADFDKAHRNAESDGTGGRGQGGNSGSGGLGPDGMLSADGQAPGDANSAGVPGQPDASSAGGAPGSGGTGTGGMNSTGGAGNDACQELTWCRDGDGDDFGDPDQSQAGCTAPGSEWITNCDDCDDGNAAVHPGAACSPLAYSPTSGAEPSFDFDCDGQETPCDAPTIANAAGCGPVGPLSCAGAGYLPSSQRAVTADQNPYCGSTEWRNCVSVGLPCVAQEVIKSPVTCR